MSSSLLFTFELCTNYLLPIPDIMSFDTLFHKSNQASLISFEVGPTVFSIAKMTVNEIEVYEFT